MFSQRTRYILKLLLYLTDHNSDSYQTVDDLSSETKIPRPYLSKVVGFLAKMGYMETKKGPNGGVRLAIDPTTTEIREILSEVGELEEDPQKNLKGEDLPAERLEKQFVGLCIRDFKRQVLGDLTLRKAVNKLTARDPELST